MNETLSNILEHNKKVIADEHNRLQADLYNWAFSLGYKTLFEEKKVLPDGSEPDVLLF